MADFGTALIDAPHTFLQPSLPLYTDTLAYLKHALDPLAADVSSLQQNRQREERKKRKRGDTTTNEDVLRLKQIHTSGLGVEQVWEQARRVIEAARREAERAVEAAQVTGKAQVNGVHGDEQDESEESKDDSLGEEGLDYEVEGLDGDGEHDDFDEMDEGLEAGAGGLDEEGFDMDGELDEDADGLGNNEPPDEFVSDKFGLNDGFFSIDNFNKQSDFLEQQDERGDDDGAASDEEDVDWDANPLGAQNGVQDGADEASQDGDEDGPTFGDPDASSEDEDEPLDEGEMDGLGAMANTNDVMYADFFAPPAQKKKKNKKGRPNPHNFPETSAKPTDEEDQDVDRTMAAVHRDLFEDDSEPEGVDEDDTALPALDPADPKSRRSAHERRKAALQEEIRKLEAANVAKREWTLSGEARAADRPMNSLLEEDLDFERAGKPVPVITAEVSESIEELIKRRILAHDFQDIIRRRPDDLNAGNARRGKLDYELDNNKSKKGLAEEYEEEHLRTTDPNYVDAKDEKMRKEEKEVEALMKKVFADLDSLSSWHFRPKQPAPQLDIRVDAPVVSMEDARPGAGQGGEASQLAPQEVYKAGEASKGKATRDEVVGKSGLPSGREEMGRDERKRRRRREKERIRKAEGNKPAANGGAGAKQGRGEKEKAMLGDLKRGGVKVIGRKGDVRDVEGNRVGREAEAGSGQNAGLAGNGDGGRYKL